MVCLGSEMEIEGNEVVGKVVEIEYCGNDIDFEGGRFGVGGEVVEILGA